ncbi:hypothetical protein GCM10027284_08740 [Cyclobacterium sediminis]
MEAYIVFGILFLGFVFAVLLILSTRKPKRNLTNDYYTQASRQIDADMEETKPTRALSEELKEGDGNRFETFIQFEVKGVHTRVRKSYILENCDEYDDLELIPEKNNPYSGQAIAVHHNEERIGYIAEKDLDEANELISQNHKALIHKIEYDGSYLSVYLVIAVRE